MLIYLKKVKARRLKELLKKELIKFKNKKEPYPSS